MSDTLPPTPGFPGNNTFSGSFENNTLWESPDNSTLTTSQPVTHWNILWTLIPLVLACMTHPIGSTRGFSPSFRYSIRTSPLVSLFDSLYLLQVVLSHSESGVSGMRDALDHAIMRRLEANSEPGETGWMTVCFRDRRVRVVLAVLGSLQYVKLYAYSGITVMFVVCTVFFVSWAVLEVALFVGSFWKRRRVDVISGTVDVWGARFVEFLVRSETVVIVAAYLVVVVPVVFEYVDWAWVGGALVVYWETLFTKPMTAVWDEPQRWMDAVCSAAGRGGESFWMSIVAVLAALSTVPIFVVQSVVLMIAIIWEFFLAFFSLAAVVAAVYSLWVFLCWQVRNLVDASGRAGAYVAELVVSRRCLAGMAGVIHMLGCLLYLLHWYSPQGTGKAEWAEKLP